MLNTNTMTYNVLLISCVLHTKLE